MHIKPGTLPERYLPNEETAFTNSILNIIGICQEVGHTDMENCSVDGDPKRGIVHLILTPNAGSTQNITVNAKMLAFKLDWYNVTISPNCCLNRIDIFIQYTFTL